MTVQSVLPLHLTPFHLSVCHSVSQCQCVSLLFSLSVSMSSVCHSVCLAFSLSVIHSVCQSFTQSVSHSLSLSVIHSVCQSFTRSVRHSLSLSVIHSVCQSFTQSVSHSLSLSVIHSICQSFTLSVSHSVSPIWLCVWCRSALQQQLRYLQLCYGGLGDSGSHEASAQGHEERCCSLCHDVCYGQR